MVASWVIGVTLNVVGSISINFATNVLKYVYSKQAMERVSVVQVSDFDAHGKSFSVEEDYDKGNTEKQNIIIREASNLVSYKTIWYIGMIIFVIGNIINFLSFAYAAQSLLAALEPAFVTNVIFGYFMLGEPVTRKIIFSTSLIVIGNVIVVIFSSHENQNYSTEELLHLYSNTLYIVYLSVTLFISFAGTILYYRLDAHVSNPKQTKRLKRTRKLMPLLYALTSGLLGTQSIIFAKSLSNIVHVSLVEGKSQFANPFTYAVLVLWLGTMVFWLQRMNNALKIFPGNRIIPVLQVVWIIFGVLSGGIYFEEFYDLSVLQISMSFVGLGFVVTGVVFLSPKTEGREEKILGTRKMSFVGQFADLEITDLPDDGKSRSKSFRQSLLDTNMSSITRRLSLPSQVVQVTSEDRERASLTTIRLNLALSTPFLDRYVVSMDRLSEIKEDDFVEEC